MNLRISHFKDGVSTDENWSKTLKSTKDIVCRWVREGAVDRVEIWDAKDRLIFHYPQDAPSA